MKKYELVNKREDGLYQVKSLMDFGNVKAGDVGGWIGKESNLSHYGNCWVYGNARVCGDAEVLKSSDYIVFKNNLTSQRYYTYTFSNDSWKVGCFKGNTEELKKHLLNKSESQKFEYGLAIEYVQKLKDFKLGLLQP